MAAAAALFLTCVVLVGAVAAMPFGESGRMGSSSEPVIAFTKVDFGKAPIEGHLWLLNVDTGATRQLTATGYQTAPSWSPDGRRLASSDRANNESVQQRIAVRPLTGDTARLLTRGHEDVDPVWSPDGRRLLWVRLDPGNRIWAMRADGTGAKVLTDGRYTRFGATWSPDGQRIGFVRARNLRLTYLRDWWVIRADGTHERRLITNASRAAWSPDGRRIAFGRPTPTYSYGCECHAADLMIAPATGGKPRLVVRNGARPAWSPDGKRIVFQRYAGNGDQTHLWIINADGTGLRQLTSGETSNDYAATWRPR